MRLPDTNVFAVLHTNRRLIGLSYRRLVLVGTPATISGFAQAGLLLVLARALTALTAETSRISGSVGPLTFTGLTIPALIGMGLGLLAIFVFAEVAAASAQASLVTNAERASRHRMLALFSSADYDKQVERPRGDTTTMLLGHTSSTARVVGQLGTGLSGFSNFSTLVIVAVILSPLAAGLVILGLLVVLSMLRPMIARTRRHSAMRTTSERRLGALLTERLELNREFRAFRAEAVGDEPISNEVEESARSQRSLLLALRMGSVIYRTGSFALVLGMLAVMDAVNASNLAALTAALLMLIRSMSYGQSLQATYQAVNAGVPVVEQLRDEVERLGAEMELEAVSPSAIPAGPHIDFEHVSFAYPGGETVLHDVSMRVEPGEFVALVGPSGAGKSTILELLLGLRNPKAGRVSVGGYLVGEIDRSWWRANVAYVPQEPKLQSGSVAESIRFFRTDVDDEAVRDAARRARIDSEIETWASGYDTDVGQLGSEVSGGQRQRIALARALAGGPEILLLDEPTSSLDPESERLIAETLNELRGVMTIVVIAHRVQTVEGADKVVVIQDGRVVPDERATSAVIHSMVGVSGTAPRRIEGEGQPTDSR